MTFIILITLQNHCVIFHIKGNDRFGVFSNLEVDNVIQKSFADMNEFLNTVCKILWSLYYYEWELIEVKFLTKKPEPNVLVYNIPANEFPKTNTEMDFFIKNAIHYMVLSQRTIIKD